VGLIPSSGGVFEVKLDGSMVFSKKASRRHVEPGEVVGLIRDRFQSGGRAASSSR
jgi:selT/selW/selH-like putative selenoprotein